LSVSIDSFVGSASCIIGDQVEATLGDEPVNRLRIAATRSTVLTAMIMFGLLSLGFAALAVDGLATGQYFGAGEVVVVSLLLAVAARSVYGAELYADKTWVGRTSPWPQRCRRDDLVAIRYAGPFISPAWEFVKRDGRVAFRVSPFMFERKSIAQLTEFLHLPPPVQDV
jgi:hypothetical protein